MLIGSPPDQHSHQQSGLYVFRPVGTDPPQLIPIQKFYCYKVKFKFVVELINSFCFFKEKRL